MRVMLGQWHLAAPAGVAAPGQVIEVEESVGRLLVERGYAAEVTEPPVETAITRSPENAVGRRMRQ
jgi:hypothetical protein